VKSAQPVHNMSGKSAHFVQRACTTCAKVLHSLCKGLAHNVQESCPFPVSCFLSRSHVSKTVFQENAIFSHVAATIGNPFVQRRFKTWMVAWRQKCKIKIMREQGISAMKVIIPLNVWQLQIKFVLLQQTFRLYESRCILTILTPPLTPPLQGRGTAQV